MLKTETVSTQNVYLANIYFMTKSISFSKIGTTQKQSMTIISESKTSGLVLALISFQVLMALVLLSTFLVTVGEYTISSGSITSWTLDYPFSFSITTTMALYKTKSITSITLGTDKNSKYIDICVYVAVTIAIHIYLCIYICKICIYGYILNIYIAYIYIIYGS